MQCLLISYKCLFALTKFRDDDWLVCIPDVDWLVCIPVVDWLVCTPDVDWLVCIPDVDRSTKRNS